MLTIGSSNLTSAQEEDEDECPSSIEKAKIIEALGSREIDQKELVAIVAKCGVSFRVTAETRREMIAAGASEAVVEAIENNYRPGAPDKAEMQLLSRAMALVREGKYSESDAIAREVIKNNPKSGEAYVVLALSAKLQGNSERASAELAKAFEFLPHDSPFRKMLDDIEQMSDGNTLETNAEAAPHYEQGNKLFEAKDFKKAAKAFEKAAKFDPTNWGIFESLAAAYFNSKQYTKARNAYREVLRLNPNHPTAGQDIADAEAKMAEEKAKQNEFFENLGKATQGVADALDETRRSGSNNGSGASSETLPSSGNNTSSVGSSSSGTLPTGKYACYNYSRHFMYNITIIDGSNYSEGRYRYNSSTGAIDWLSGDLADRDYYIGGYAFTNSEGQPQINIKLNSSRDSEYYCYRQ